MFLTNILTLLHSCSLIILTLGIKCSALHSKQPVLAVRSCSFGPVIKIRPAFVPLRNAAY